MDKNQLSKFFPLSSAVDPDTQAAIDTVRDRARELAETIQRLLPESNSKTELQMRVFHVLRDCKLSLKFDGPSRMTPMIVTRQ